MPLLPFLIRLTNIEVPQDQVRTTMTCWQGEISRCGIYDPQRDDQAMDGDISEAEADPFEDVNVTQHYVTARTWTWNIRAKVWLYR